MIKKEIKFLKKKFLKSWHRHVKCSFENSVFLSDKKEKIFCSLSENQEKWKFFEKMKYSLNCFSGQIECSFEDPAGKLRTKHRKFFAQCPKMIEWHFFQRSYFSLNDFFAHENAASTNRQKHFRQTAESFVLNVRRLWETFHLCQKKALFYQNVSIENLN